MDDPCTVRLEWLHFFGSVLVLLIIGAVLLRPVAATPETPTTSEVHVTKPTLEARIQLIRPTADAPRLARAIVAAAETCGTNPYYVAALMEVESRYRADAESETGARGLMQLVRSTAESLGVRWEAAYDVELNTTAGACYLARHLQKYDGRLDLAARRYNGNDDPRFAQKVLARYRAISGSTALVVKVRRGDTLARLAATYLDDQSGWRRLAAQNGITDPHRLEPGRWLVIHG